MKANELRIGNWININGQYVNIGYGVIMDMHKKQKGIKNSYLDTLTFNPIPLTPEILEKCGFTKMNNGWNMGERKSYMDVIFSLFDDNYCQGELDLRLNGSDLPMPKVKYLHQLQNLYFALTGEELTFKP